MIFISNNWADAHQQTRLNTLLKLGISITCLSVFRNYYPNTSSISPVSIGNVEHASYRKRLKIYVNLFFQLSKQENAHDCIYVYGFDFALTLLIFRIVSRRKFILVYEIPDIRERFFSKQISGKLLRLLEAFVIPKIDLLVVTSADFVTEYLTKLRKIRIRDYLVIENKIHSIDIVTLPINPSQTVENKMITIGYFGVLRCPASLNCLIMLARSGRFDIVLKGIFMPFTQHFKNEIFSTPNIHYYGPYKMPDELSTIYSQVDMVWAVYPFSEKAIGNHLWARTNRFYESLFFCKPFIVQQGTADAAKARNLGNIAIEINLEDINQVVDELLTLKKEDLHQIKKLLLNVREDNYMITNEYNDLIQCLQQKK